MSRIGCIRCMSSRRFRSKRGDAICLSERSFDCTLPLLFNGADASGCARADECWDALFRTGRETGCMPYRVHMGHGALIAGKESPYWRTVERIRNALDPLEMLSPVRWTSDTAASFL
ncbi:hypothetical protein PSP6_210240 [Paraburkholderia tropica]|nr:hypothetical protein PSP6_210240 [Paraburkholderia tropica]